MKRVLSLALFGASERSAIQPSAPGPGRRPDRHGRRRLTSRRAGQSSGCNAKRSWWCPPPSVETTLINAPATMSVIDDATRSRPRPRRTSATCCARLPGLNVIQTSARDINITSRQGTSTLANSQLVLLDGRSIYLDFFGLVLWDFVPQSPAEIKQIEVVRGPASAVWGANALTGVVNIITKSPRETPRASTSNLQGGLFNRERRLARGRRVRLPVRRQLLLRAGPQRELVLAARPPGYFNSDPYSRPTGRCRSTATRSA